MFGKNERRREKEVDANERWNFVIHTLVGIQIKQTHASKFDLCNIYVYSYNACKPIRCKKKICKLLITLIMTVILSNYQDIRLVFTDH